MGYWIPFETLSSIAEENAAATQQISASMQEQTASAESIAQESEGLEQLFNELQGIIKSSRSDSSCLTVPHRYNAIPVG